MEHENIHQARFSKDYLLLIGRDRAGVWWIQINGPRPINGPLESIHLSEAQSEAYTVADRHFMQKGIVDPRIPREEMVWVAHP
jgi:hypothetical protein